MAFAGYRNVTLGTARELTLRGAGPDEFFSESAGSLAGRTGLRAEYFDEATREAALERAGKEIDFLRDNRVRAIYCEDAAYPRRLTLCDDAPAMLYMLGDGDLNPRYCVSIVGTRHATAYGAEFTARLVSELGEALPEGLQIVSGLAYGIDIAAHEAAMRAGIPTGAVLAHGLNTVYPMEHRRQAMDMVRHGGFLATEYTSQARTHRGNFLARNRIVAGMADAVVVVESDMRGGAMATARIASAYSREVLALPGRVSDPYSRGCNDLLARGTARVVRDAGDILDAMGWKAARKSRKEAAGQLTLQFEPDPEKTAILRAIGAEPEADVNELCAALGMPFGRLSALLFELEMDDLVVGIPGGRYGLTAVANDFLAGSV